MRPAHHGVATSQQPEVTQQWDSATSLGFLVLSWQSFRLWLVCQLPVAAVTNFHQLGGFKQHTFLSSQFWRAQVLSHFHREKSRCQQGPASLQRLEGKLCFLPLEASGLGFLEATPPQSHTTTSSTLRVQSPLVSYFNQRTIACRSHLDNTGYPPSSRSSVNQICKDLFSFFVFVGLWVVG